MINQTIKAWDGWILGFIKELPSGDMIATDQTGRIVGRYKKNFDMTTTDTGVFVCKGNNLSMMIPPDSRKGS